MNIEIREDSRRIADGDSRDSLEPVKLPWVAPTMARLTLSQIEIGTGPTNDFDTTS